MAEIPWPAVASITGFTLRQLYTGDTTHRSIYTGAQQTLARAPGRWTGTVTIAVEDNEADRQEIEAWIVGLRGTVNTTNIPLLGRDGPAGLPNDVWAVNSAASGAGVTRRDANHLNADGSVWLTMRSGARASERGHYVRVGARLYCVMEFEDAIPWILGEHNVLQPGIRVLPGVLPVTDASDAPMVRTGVEVRAQVLDEPVELPMDGEYAGPWTIEWIEVP